jgi:hypothetical protein
MSSAKPLLGSALGVTVGVPGVGDGPVGLTAWVCANAAWVSNALTVAVAGSVVGLNKGVLVGLGVVVAVGVELAVSVGVEVLVTWAACANTVPVSCSADNPGSVASC